MVLENEIHEIVGTMKNKRYLKFSLHTSVNSQFTWNLYPIIRVPEEADWKKAKIDNEDMEETFPNQREAIITVLPTTETNWQIYAVWDMPANIPLPMIYPYNLFIGGAISFVVSLVSKFTYDKIVARKNPHSRQNDETAKRLKHPTAKESLWIKGLFPVLGILAGLLYILTPMLFILTPEQILALVNGITTVVLVIITASHVRSS